MNIDETFGSATLVLAGCVVQPCVSVSEVVGALISILIIWEVTFVLVYLAVQRIRENKYADVEPNTMLITACVGVSFNVVLVSALKL